MVWLPVNGRLPVVPAGAPCEEVAAPAPVAPEPVGPEPAVPPALELPPAVLDPPPNVAVVVGVVVGDEDPPEEPVGPVAMGWKGSMPGVAEAAAPVPTTTAAIRAPTTIMRASVVRLSTLRAVIATMLRATGVKSASFASGMRTSSRGGGSGTGLRRAPAQVSGQPVPMTRTGKEAGIPCPLCLGKEAEVYGSQRCEEILRLIDEALDGLGTDAPAPRPRTALWERPRRDRSRRAVRPAATATTRPAA
jgi:hypothetical protein